MIPWCGADFTSSLVLGRPSLTTGTPAVLGEPAVARRVAASVAAAQGAAAGLVARSTLHALTDVFGTLPGPGDVVALDAATYPITRWAVLLAAARGATVCHYPHRQPATRTARRLFLVTDGWCPGCNRPAPLRELHRLADILIVDDSLAFGVLGDAGSLRWSGIDHERVVWVASLAKAYGAPLAVITGDQATMRRLSLAGNRMHSSPPSRADLAAAATALADRPANRARRARLAGNVRYLRAALRSIGLPPNGLPFPLVTVSAPDRAAAYRWWRRLSARGLHTVVQRPQCRRGALLSMLVRADHTTADLDQLAAALRESI